VLISVLNGLKLVADTSPFAAILLAKLKLLRAPPVVASPPAEGAPRFVAAYLVGPIRPWKLLELLLLSNGAPIVKFLPVTLLTVLFG
jgi:hypothetical protein